MSTYMKIRICQLDRIFITGKNGNLLVDYFQTEYMLIIILYLDNLYSAIFVKKQIKWHFTNDYFFNSFNIV